ncbi:hypothetical protein [Clostridium sp.]|uniref:hypothetical protein n=1 Tax=Clostridium sp. TaxID=1506 RepID=UPI00284DA7E4|nr:hypothetical protein [Clostridium sp.]MDR3598614.1 hypothetical protein [Clostridium sp.]
MELKIKDDYNLAAYNHIQEKMKRFYKAHEFIDLLSKHLEKYDYKKRKDIEYHINILMNDKHFYEEIYNKFLGCIKKAERYNNPNSRYISFYDRHYIKECYESNLYFIKFDNDIEKLNKLLE